MRMGDLDALKAQLNKLPMMSNWGEAFMPLLIDEQPTIDAVPVVRCRECSKKDKNICPLVLVQFDRNMKQVLVQKPVPDDFFYSYGQRKDDAHD